MRQFFSWRIWAAFGALAVIAVTLRLVLPHVGGVEGIGPTRPNDRHIDFVSTVYSVEQDNLFAIHDGVVTGSAEIVLDGQRTMHIRPGTLGENGCPRHGEIGQCVVFADLLGDAVIWFALAPLEPTLKVNGPPIVDILDDGVVRLSNGWLLPTIGSVDRRCATETESLREFLREFGRGSTTIIDVATGEVSAVRCAEANA